MLKSQSALIEMSKVREEINALPDDAEADTLNGLTARYQRTEAAYRAALIAEGQDNAAAAPSEDGQPAEVRGLLKRASLGIYLTGTAAQQEVGGAEKELRQAIFGDDARVDLFPIDLLASQDAPASEERADAATNIGSATAESGTTFSRGLKLEPAVIGTKALRFPHLIPHRRWDIIGLLGAIPP